MLIPQFSLRTLLLLTAAAAALFSVFALATRGHIWAIGISAAIGALVILMLLFATAFLLLQIVAASLPSFAGLKRARSPFMPDKMRVTTEKDIAAAPIVVDDADATAGAANDKPDDSSPPSFGAEDVRKPVL